MDGGNTGNVCPLRANLPVQLSFKKKKLVIHNLVGNNTLPEIMKYNAQFRYDPTTL